MIAEPRSSSSVRSVEPLLAITDDLERRDAVVAGELARVEQLQAEVEELRADASAASDALEWLPRTIAQHERALTDAEQEHAAATHRPRIST